MSEFDIEVERQNWEVFSIVHNNPRRRGVIRDIGVIVTNDQAQRFAAYEASQSRAGGGIGSLILVALALLAMVTAVVVALA